MGGGGCQPGDQQVSIEQPFYIGVYPVTQAQWQAVMGSNPSHFDASQGGGPDHPVEQVSWDDVQEFSEKLNAREQGLGLHYRLPTEAEWEYACRGGATSREDCSYHFYLDQPSNALNSRQANFDGSYPEGGAAKGPYLERTSKVGSMLKGGSVTTRSALPAGSVGRMVKQSPVMMRSGGVMLMDDRIAPDAGILLLWSSKLIRTESFSVLRVGIARLPGRRHVCWGLAASIEAQSVRLLGLGLLQRREREQLDFARRLAAIFEVAIATAAAAPTARGPCGPRVPHASALLTGCPFGRSGTSGRRAALLRG
jgi:hypothetical protein